MKRIFSLLLLIVLVATWARADEGGYMIHKAHVEAVVHENSTWDVTETLQVEFTESRHGIYRFIPTVFEVDGNKYKNKLSNVEVDGYNFEVTDNDDSSDKEENKIIRIGSANSFVDGEQTYVIHYTLQYMDDRIGDYDFLLHTIWGTDWNTPIDEMSFSIKFDKDLPEGFADGLEVYSGGYGTRGNDADVEIEFDQASNTITGYARDMEPMSGVTLAAKLPQGYWKPESKNRTIMFIFLVFTVVCAVMYLIKVLGYRRRDPMRVVSFYPPGGISSAEVGKIIDDSSDMEDLASLIPWFAHYGYITITEVPDKRGRFGSHADLRLDIKEPLPPDAPQYQKYFMEAIFGSKNSVLLSNLGDRHAMINLSKNALDRVYTGDRKLTEINGGLLWWFLMLLGAAGVLWTGHVCDSFNTELPLWGAFTGVGAAVIAGIIRLTRAPMRSIRSASSKIIELVLCAAIVVVGVIFANAMIDSYLLCFPKVFLLGGFAALGASSLLLDRTSVDTKYRLDIMGQLLGLRDFIKTAELQQLKMLVDENPQYFYDILPYAMVFGLSDKWADQFKAINISNPDWYHTSDPSLMMSSALMANAITHSVNQSIRSAVTKASVDHSKSSGSGSSFSGGGGGFSFSGGGGGGGGGGSW